MLPLRIPVPTKLFARLLGVLAIYFILLNLYIYIHISKGCVDITMFIMYLFSI